MRTRLLFPALMLLCGAGRLSGQTDEFANRLVVMIKAGSSQGAGIICGVDDRGAYIATADHVVRPGATPARISVRFFDQPDRELNAELLPRRDAELDIAVIRVPALRDLPPPAFRHKADLGLLGRGSEVYLLGNPGGRAWRMSLRPEAIAQIRGDLLEFESNLITGGHSGGALLTAGKDVAGMLRSDNPPYGEAVSIDRILERLKSWGYRVNLSLPLPKLTLGSETNCHLQPSGQARCWSIRENGPELETVPNLQFVDIAAGYDHVCGIDINAKAFCWGRNTSGQLGTGNLSERQDSPLAVSGGRRFTAITAGGAHACALDQERRAWCWGAGSEGRLGNDTGKDSSVPVEVAGGLRFQNLSAGSRHTCGVTDGGDLYCWGGILGSGRPRSGVDAADAFVPLQIAANLKFRAVSAGGELSCAVSLDGDGYCWGSTDSANVRGLPRPARLEVVRVPGRLKFVAISAGPLDHACGVTTDLRAHCWGANDYGQLGDGGREDSLIPVTVAANLAFESVTAGFQQTCAISGTSTYCWGRIAGNDGKPVRYAALGGSPGNTRLAAPPARTSAPAAVAGKSPAVEWKGAVERPLFGFWDECQAADVEFLGQPDKSFAIQLKCQIITNEPLTVIVKSAGGARTVTGRMGERTLDQDRLNRWGADLEREVLALTEAISYPAFRARSASAVVHPSGRLDELQLDSTGHLQYLSAVPAAGRPTSLEISFARYRQVDGVNVPFEIRLFTREVATVLKLREIRFIKE